MPVKIFDENNWSNMEVFYVQDNDLQTKQQKIFSDSCINFSYPELFVKTLDQKNNNYSSFALTSSVNFSKIFSLTNPTENGNGFVTTLSNGLLNIKDTAQRYWKIVPSLSSNYLDITTNNFLSEKNPDNYFEIDFIPNNLCRISHDYYNSKYYLNVNFLTNRVYLLSSTSDIYDNNSLYHQAFEYIFDDVNNCIALFYRKNNNVYTLVKQFSSLGFVALTGSDIQLTIENTFNVLPIKFNLIDSLSSHWFSYKKEFDTNNLNVECTDSSVVKNQIVFHSEFNNISSEKVPYNFVTEKNNLTPKSENISLGENKDVRSYVSLNTGAPQEKGNLRFSQNYQSKINEYKFKPGKLTYFHTPLEMGEYNFININDSNLAECGAIYSNTPEFSDKIWKKNANYKDTSNFGNPRGEINGTWICSWLSGSSNPNTRPIWYDRYFIPNKTTRQMAFSANDVFAYESYYDCITNQVSVPTEIFDVKSQMTFEPYTLYAYYRIGKQDINEYILKNDSSILFNGIDQYIQTNGTILAAENGVYKFSGNEYAINETINSKSFDNRFTFFFTIGSKDFNQSFGHEIVGNYKNTGIGVYSDRAVTPFVRFIDGNILKIYNSEWTLLDTIQFNNSLLDVVQIESLDDYFVLDNTGELFQINSQNTILDSSQYNPLSAAISHHSDETSTYFLVSHAGDFVSYNRRTEQFGFNNLTRYYSTTPMVSAKSLKKIGNAVYILDGNDSEIREQVRIFYKSNGEIKEWNVSLNNIETRFYNSSGTITTFTIDNNLNFFIFDNNSTCYVHNSAGFVINTFRLPVSATNVIASDFSSTYIAGENISTVYAICSSTNSTGSVALIDTKTLVTNEDVIVLNYPVSACFNVPTTNSVYNHEVLNETYPENGISIRINLPNVYTSEASEELNLSFDATQLKFGYHEFALSFDSVAGKCVLFVNGQIVDSKTFSPGKYTLSQIFNEPFTYGSTQYFAGINLYDKLKIKNAFTIKNLDIRDVFFFTKPLDYYTIRFIQKYSKNIQPLLFNLPSESRNYADTIEKFFRQRIPYHKSPAIDITINNSKITNKDARAYIQKQLNTILLNNLPYMSELRNFIWKENMEKDISFNETDQSISTTETQSETSGNNTGASSGGSGGSGSGGSGSGGSGSGGSGSGGSGSGGSGSGGSGSGGSGSGGSGSGGSGSGGYSGGY